MVIGFKIFLNFYCVFEGFVKSYDNQFFKIFLTFICISGDFVKEF